MTVLIIRNKRLVFVSFLFILLLCSVVKSNYFVDPFLYPKNFFFLYVIFLLVLSIVLINNLNKKLLNLSLNYIDVAVLAYFIYITFTIVITNKPALFLQKYILYSSLILCYFLFKSCFSSFLTERSILITLLLIGFINCVIGLGQFVGVSDFTISPFNTKGFFDNPAPYSIFLVSLFPFVFGVLFFNKDKFLNNILLGLVCGLMVFVIFLTQSRAAWIAFAVSCAYVAIKRFNIFNAFKSKQAWVFFIITGIVLIVISSYYLYNLKPDSVHGRLFIYKTNVSIIMDKPIFGHGYNSYNRTHNNYQAEYFKIHPGDEENAQLAANLEYAFNEYLQIWIENGIIGLLLFLIPVVLIFKDKNENRLVIFAKASLLAILTAALFSYPFSSLPVLLVFYMLLAICSSQDEKIAYNLYIPLRISRFIYVLMFLIFVSLLIINTKVAKAHTTWKKASQFVQSDVSYFEEYKKVFPVLRYNPYFLYNYGAELSVAEMYNKSILILEMAKNYLNGADLYTYLGNSYEGIGNIEKAEESFLQAMYLIPHRFYPRYRLVLLYEKTGQIEKAIKLANEIVEMDVKVESEIVNRIKKEMSLWLEVH